MLAPVTVTRSNGSHRNWLSILDEFDVQFLVLDTHRDRHLCQIIQSQPGWSIDFQAGKEILFTRTQGSRGTQAAA